jgi:hypothetical protein
MKRTNEVFIEITTWMGMSLGAIHYYGELKGYKSEDEGSRIGIVLEHGLTQREATVLNKAGDFHYALYKKGAMYRGFSSKEEIIELGLKVWKEYFPNATILILGRNYAAEPQKVLVGPPNYMEKVNAWVEQFPHGDWIEESYKIADEFQKYHDGYEGVTVIE